MILTKRDITSTDDTKFIEIVRIEGGTITLQNLYPLYAELEATLARRTYDESGNYTVRPFTMFLTDYVQDNLDYGAQGIPITDSTKISAKLSAGKAYVRGHEIETVSPTNLALNRARDTESVQNYDVYANYGNYVTVANTVGLFDVASMKTLDMHNVDAGAINTSSSGTYNATKIGTVRLRELEYVSAGNTQLSNTYSYNAYLNDTRFTTNNTAIHIKSFAIINASTKIVTSANISTSSISSGNTYFSDTDYKSLLFRMPQSFITFGMADQSYQGRIVFSNQTVTTGNLSISTGAANNLFIGTGSLSQQQILENFRVTANNTTGSEFINGQVFSFHSTTNRSITTAGTTASIDLKSASTFTVDVVASVNFNTPTPKTKTLVSANTTAIGTSPTIIGNTSIYLASGQVAISTPNKTPGSSDPLYISDIHKLEGKFEEEYGYFNVYYAGKTVKASFKVIDSGNTAAAVSTSDLSNTSKDITTKYTLDDGQRDGYYDHGSIVLRHGVTPPTGQILILVNYFTHTGSGYFTLDSYNNISVGADADTRYRVVPNYTSPTTGEVFKLRDCIDFRPRRADAANTTPNFTLSGVSVPVPGTALQSDYSYYLPRIDRIVLTENKKFKVIEGVSSLLPQTPSEPDTAMSLYTVRINPFTFFPSDTKIKYIENKRYTMRDIGNLDKRISNLEYYTSLNTLEKSAQDLTIVDASGLPRFKNGILVDTFKGHSVGDVSNFDYVCSMDFTEGVLRPSFKSDSISFTVSSLISNTTTDAGTIITVPYTLVNVITQNVATDGLAVNPFTLTNYSGTISLSPPGDFWIDTTTRPDVIVDLNGENDAYSVIGSDISDPRQYGGYGTQYGDWTSYVSGVDTTTTTTTQDRTEGYYTYQDTIETSVTTTQNSRSRVGTIQVTVPGRVIKSIGTRQVDLSVVPYVRAQWVNCVVQGVKPNLFHYLFAKQNDLAMAKYVENSTSAWLYDVVGDFDDSYGVYETITSSSGGTATLLKQVSRSWSVAQVQLRLVDIRGTFAPADTITGSISGATAKIDIFGWSSGNVSTATSNTITMLSGSPLNNTYTANTATVDAYAWPFTGVKVWERSGPPRNSTITITSGTGIGQQRYIWEYNGTTKVAKVIPNWTINPDSTSTWTISRGVGADTKVSSDDIGGISCRIYIPNYSATAYDNGFKLRTGAQIFRWTNSILNSPTVTNSFAEENWFAQGVLNTVENVSVGVRINTIHSGKVYETEDNYKQTSVVSSSITGSTLIADTTPPPSVPNPTEIPPAPLASSCQTQPPAPIFGYRPDGEGGPGFYYLLSDPEQAQIDPSTYGDGCQFRIDWTRFVGIDESGSCVYYMSDMFADQRTYCGRGRVGENNGGGGDDCCFWPFC
jgi:hypothetical protein